MLLKYVFEICLPPCILIIQKSNGLYTRHECKHKEGLKNNVAECHDYSGFLERRKKVLSVTMTNVPRIVTGFYGH